MNVERGLEDLGVFTAEFQQRHEVLRRYFAGGSPGQGGEGRGGADDKTFQSRLL